MGLPGLKKPGLVSSLIYALYLGSGSESNFHLFKED